MLTDLPNSDDVLEALARPVYVDDPDDNAEVFEALLAAWRERVPAFETDEGAPADGEPILFLVGIKVTWRYPDMKLGEESGETLSRGACASLRDGVDPWDAFQLAFIRASHLWGLRPAKRVDWGECVATAVNQDEIERMMNT